MILLKKALGIVGSEAAKFTPETERKARWVIRWLLKSGRYYMVVSGGCHLGGIDVWAMEEAEKFGVPTVEFLPTERSWARGYKLRNQKIAIRSDHVVCITVKELPEGYTGMRFAYCYHCNTRDHIKSGGCWTVKYAKHLGKTGEIIAIQ
jgi:hypothetical protein